jgi:hypothetical protein
VVVTICLFLEDGANVRHCRDVVQSTGSDGAIQQPLVESLDLSFGLGEGA